MSNRRTVLLFALALLPCLAADKARPLPKVPEGWTIELVKEAPEIAYPTAIVAEPQGNAIYLGQDPMDMPGPPTSPIDSILRIDKDGKTTVFAEKLWAVMGLEWADSTLYVVHAPFLSAFRDKDGDGKADERVDLMTGLGPVIPAFNGINDHVASGIRLGMDGYLYISVGDKGIAAGVGKDGVKIQLFGGGVIRIRPDGTGLEVVSTGERNPLSVALSKDDEIFTYGNDDDSKKWPNSLTHHIVGGHHGYPYQFLDAPGRALPIMGGEIGGSGAQAICYNESLSAGLSGKPPGVRLGLANGLSNRDRAKRGNVPDRVKDPVCHQGRRQGFSAVFALCRRAGTALSGRLGPRWLARRWPKNRATVFAAIPEVSPTGRPS